MSDDNDFLSPAKAADSDTSNKNFLSDFGDSPAAAPEGRSVIGKNIKFRGELIGTEDLKIDGTIDGVVIMSGHDLEIGEGGVITANVHAKNIVVDGTLTGDVLAQELIEVRKTAVVKGNLIAPQIQLDAGGKFRGSMDMVDTDQEMKDRFSEFKDKLVHPELPEDKSLAASQPSKSGFGKQGGFASAPAKADPGKDSDKGADKAADKS